MNSILFRITVILGFGLIGQLNELGSAMQPEETPVNSMRKSDFDQSLEKLDSQFAQVERIRARFEQQKSTPMLRRPMVSSGTVLVKGRTVRWNTLKPSKSVMVAKPGELQMYFPEAKVLEIYSTDRTDASSMVNSPLPRLGVLREHFIIEELPIDVFKLNPSMGLGAKGLMGLSLKPKSSELAEQIEYVHVLIDSSVPFVRQVVIAGFDGEVTTITLSKERMGARISNAEMEIAVPEGTRISWPMGDQKPRSAGGETSREVISERGGD